MTYDLWEVHESGHFIARLATKESLAAAKMLAEQLDGRPLDWSYVVPSQTWYTDGYAVVIRGDR